MNNNLSSSASNIQTPLNSSAKSSSSNSLALTDTEITSHHNVVHSIFNSTKCYDLMQNSSKGTVFETTIPFQLAFFALVEHDTDVAPLWDPDSRQFVGLMTVYDYIQTLRVWRSKTLPTSDLTIRTIHDMLSTHYSSIIKFKHNGFQSIDAEDTVVQLCLLLFRTGHEYVPIIDADNGNLVSILGYLDIIHLLDQAAVEYPNLFCMSIQQLRIGTYSDVITASKFVKVCEILDALESKNISSLPIIDESGKVIDIYHKSDVSFIIKASDPDEVIRNLSNYRVEEAIIMREQLLASGDIMSSFQGLVTCKLSYSLSQVVRAMMIARSTKAVIVDDNARCIGILSVKDIIRYYLNENRG